MSPLIRDKYLSVQEQLSLRLTFFLLPPQGSYLAHTQGKKHQTNL